MQSTIAKATGKKEKYLVEVAAQTSVPMVYLVHSWKSQMQFSWGRPESEGCQHTSRKEAAKTMDKVWEHFLQDSINMLHSMTMINGSF